MQNTVKVQCFTCLFVTHHQVLIITELDNLPSQKACDMFMQWIDMNRPAVYLVHQYISSSICQDDIETKDKNCYLKSCVLGGHSVATAGLSAQ